MVDFPYPCLNTRWFNFFKSSKSQTCHFPQALHWSCHMDLLDLSPSFRSQSGWWLESPWPCPGSGTDGFWGKAMLSLSFRMPDHTSQDLQEHHARQTLYHFWISISTFFFGVSSSLVEYGNGSGCLMEVVYMAGMLMKSASSSSRTRHRFLRSAKARPRSTVQAAAGYGDRTLRIVVASSQATFYL